MGIVNHHRRRFVFHTVGRYGRSLDLEGPQVWFWVLARAIHQRQTGQEQDILLKRHATELTHFDADGIDAMQENTNV